MQHNALKEDCEHMYGNAAVGTTVGAVGLAYTGDHIASVGVLALGITFLIAAVTRAIFRRRPYRL
jgi:hypothetical protein